MQGELTGDIVTEQWLNRHAIKIPRAAGVFTSKSAWIKVDGHGTIIAAGELDQRIVAWLVERGILSSTDIDYSIAYITCRDAHRAYRKEKGYKSFLDVSLLAAGNITSCEQAAMVFSLVRKDLGQKYRSIIEYACDTVRNAQTGNYNPPYRNAFSALAHAFDAAVRAVRDGEV